MKDGQKRYREFLKTEFWKCLSDRVKRGVTRCQKCGRKSKHLEAHHVIYRARWEDTLEEDLVVICRGCHLRAHGFGNEPWMRYSGRSEEENRILYRMNRLFDSVLKGRSLRDRDKSFLENCIERYPATAQDGCIEFKCRNLLKFDQLNYGIHQAV